MKRAFVVFAFIYGCICAPLVHACIVDVLAPSNVDRLLPDVISHSEAIVHARVERAEPSTRDHFYSATLIVLRSFKGNSPSTTHVKSIQICGHPFRMGEEGLFFIKQGYRVDPTVYSLSPWLLEALARHQ
jgi:hypothetical protein